MKMFALFLIFSTATFNPSVWGKGTTIRVIYGSQKNGGPNLAPPSDLTLDGLNAYTAEVPNMTVISDAVKYVHRFGGPHTRRVWDLL